GPGPSNVFLGMFIGWRKTSGGGIEVMAAEKKSNFYNCKLVNLKLVKVKLRLGLNIRISPSNPKVETSRTKTSYKAKNDTLKKCKRALNSTFKTECKGTGTNEPGCGTRRTCGAARLTKQRTD